MLHLVTPIITCCFLQLCAAGTVGVAAVGLVLARPSKTSQNLRAPSSHQVFPSAVLNEPSSTTNHPSTPDFALQIHPASAPVTRLRKRTSVNRPVSASSRLSFGTWTRSSSDMRGQADNEAQRRSALQNLEGPEGEEAQNVPVDGTFSTRSSWRRPRSLLQLSATSTSTTPPPGSPSVAHSNGSSVPMLPQPADFGGNTMPRNKLVKRSSSQRALQGSSTMYSTLRRPATSHQRTATLQQHFLEGGSHDPTEGRHSSGTPLNNLEEDAHPQDEEDPIAGNDVSHQLWHPFFRSRTRRVLSDRSSGKRSSSSTVLHSEIHRTVVPNINDVPTLTLGGSISTQSSDDSGGMSDLPTNDISRPASAEIFEEDRPHIVDSTGREAEVVPIPRSRRSFSLSGLFSTPSPSTGKMPRSGSLRRSSLFTTSTSKRRIFSAPHNLRAQGSASISPEGRIPPNRRKLRQFEETSAVPPVSNSSLSGPSNPFDSSPSPPLNRLSTFEFELPGVAPLYPEPIATPPLASSLDRSSPISPPSLSPFNSFRSRNKAHRPSGAPSDLTSTLVDSENDNSRLISGDEDEFDGRSDTVYDSTRTGATGSSHSALRRPAIETIFDESPKMGDQETKSVMRENASSNETILASDHQQGDAATGQGGHSVPLRVSASCKEEASPTPAPSPETRQAEIGLAKTTTTVNFHTGLEDINDLSENDDDWGFARSQESPSFRLNGSRNDTRSTSNVPPPVPQLTHAPQTLDVSVQVDDRSMSKSNVFDWSENPSGEQHGSMPRPKTMNGKHGSDARGSRLNGRRGTNAMHLRSQSVPVSSNSSDHRHSSNTAKLESWVLGSRGVSEEWDDDFLVEESENSPRPDTVFAGTDRASNTSTMLIPHSIMERQASVHGQFGHVKELTLLVEELKRLQQQASAQGIIGGQSAELWKEAEGIINLATVDEDAASPPNRSPRSPSFEFDLSDEESPQSHQRKPSNLHAVRESQHSGTNTMSGSPTPSRPSPDKAKLDTPPTSSSRPRRESAAKAKSVLENIYHHRSPHSSPMLHATTTPEKLPFDTTSLRDLVTRAGVITRALKEVVRRAEESNRTANTGVAPPPPPPPSEPSPPTPDPAYTRIFQQRPPSPPAPLTPSSLIPKASTPSSKSPTTSPTKTLKMSRAASGTKSPKGNKSPKRASSVHKTSVGSLNSSDSVATMKSPRTPTRSPKNGSYVGGNGGGGTVTAGNDNDITGHMKIMTVV